MTTAARAATGAVDEPLEIRGLLDWMDAPRAGVGIRFADEEDGWRLYEYSELAALSAGTAQQIAAERHRPDGPVVIVTHTSPQFFSAFAGSLMAGNTPSPLALNAFVRDRNGYIEYAASIMRAADPALVLVEEGLEDMLTEAVRRAGIAAGVARIEPTEARPFVPAPEERAELALLQFTSGSSGTPRGVRVTWDNLESNIAMILRWVGVTPSDSIATWLPLYHDMGLVGCLLSPMVHQNDIWVMRPDQFIRDPLRWIDCFGRRGASITAAPNFGFGYAAKRLREEDLEGMDFSGWRCAILGAERNDPEVLGRFAARLEPYGFKRETYAPAYGLAEGTLQVSGVPMSSVARVVKPDWKATGHDGAVVVEDEARLGELDRIGNGDGWLVSCGPVNAEIDCTVVDDEQRPVGDGVVGEISLAGPSIADGYHGEAAGPRTTRFEGERVYTGDAGFLLDGELYVLGRLGDSLKVRGRQVFVEDLEARAATFGVQKGKCVILAGDDNGRNVLAALVEDLPGPWVHRIAGMLQRTGKTATRVVVIAGERGAIERTSSGKPRRRVMWRQFIDGTLPGTVVHDSAAAKP
ncbi:MAG TPA: AMP-binding protein [Thermoleophilaceae bacterium]